MGSYWGGRLSGPGEGGLTEVAIAEQIARKAHAGQKEESTGDPYIRHVERVVGLVEGDSAKAVAWLHDVVEDSDLSLMDLREAGISEPVTTAVAFLTRVPNITYETYISHLKASRNQLALAVKLADLKDHLRPNCPERLKPRYEAAVRELGAAPPQGREPPTRGRDEE